MAGYRQGVRLTDECIVDMKDGLDFLENRKLILASASPRRRELLAQLGASVELAPVRKVDESYPEGTAPEEVPVYISRVKALAYSDMIGENEILVTADTVVIDGGRVLGKPRDAADACAMLEELSGHTHKVVTGVTLMSAERHLSFGVVTEVDFAPLGSDEIDYYVERYRPFDKAGAYGIQEWIGYVGITGIRGDYYNVMGLPLCALYARLKEIVR